MAIWLGLAVLLVAVVAGITYAVLRGIQFYREAKRVGDVLGNEVERINVTTAQIEEQLRKSDEAKSRLKVATDRLALSRARLNVQIAAAHEARAQLRRVFWFVPGV